MGQKVTLLDKVTVDGKEVSREEEQIVIAFNKPVGVECTTDKNNPDVGARLNRQWKKVDGDLYINQDKDVKLQGTWWVN